MVKILTEGPRTAGYLISEANGCRSRDVVTLNKGNKLDPGTVLGVIEASGKYAAFNPKASTGEQLARAILFSHVDATEAECAAVISARDTEVNAYDLIWPEGITPEQRKTAISNLADVGIIVR